MADAHLRGEVDDAVYPLQRLGHGVAVADIGADELDIVLQTLRSFAVAMDLLDHAVEEPHLVTAAQKFPRHGASDETGPAGDKDLLGHMPSPFS